MIRYVIIFLAGTSFLCSAQSADEVFLHANKCYQEQEYVQALEFYQSITNKGVATWYNLGNTNYKLGNYADALVCWKVAEKEARADELEAIQYNIAALEKKLDKEQSAPSSVNTALKNYSASWSLLFAQLFFLLCWYLLYFFFRRTTLSTHIRIAILGILLLLTGLGASVLGIKYASKQKVTGIITKPPVHVFAGPDKQFHAVTSLEKITEVRIKEQRDQWFKINHGPIVGWVSADDIVVI